MQGLGCRVAASGRHFPNSSAARHLGCLRQQRSSPVRPRMEPAAAGMSGSAVPAGSPAAATAAAPHPLWQRIEERYNIAQREAAATMTDTNTEVVEDGGIRFVLRVAARLRDKPKPPADGVTAGDNGRKKEWRNPFLPYEQALWVADLGGSHVLLLNKFNIVPWHCLVVTSDYQSQLDDLNAVDLGATWRVLQSMPHGGLSFFNCGPCSGASQPHKHVQIVPLPLDDADSTSSSDSSRERPPIWPAVATATRGAPAGQPVELRNLPFAAFAATLAPPLQQQQQAVAAASGDPGTGEYLSGIYQQLLGRCRGFVDGKTGRQGVHAQDGSLSYNMVCTADFMMLVPRRHEAAGPVSCNSVAFAGSIFVRSREEQQAVVQQGPLHILTATGYEW